MEAVREKNNFSFFCKRTLPRDVMSLRTVTSEESLGCFRRRPSPSSPSQVLHVERDDPVDKVGLSELGSAVSSVFEFRVVVDFGLRCETPEFLVEHSALCARNAGVGVAGGEKERNGVGRDVGER